MTQTTRPPAVAGMFYPDEPDLLREHVLALLRAAPTAGAPPKAVIVPHAGYIYSGPIAATAYARIAKARGKIRRVVLLGPAHRVAFSGIAVSSATAFTTPLGDVPVDIEALQLIDDLPQVVAFDPAHAVEHSLEVQLPFLQVALDDFKLVALVAGDATTEHVDNVLERLWGDAETLIVISSDLSHYHDYDSARRIDQATSRAIEALREQDIENDHACGRIPVNGLLRTARHHGLRARTVDLRNSGDTAGGREHVVGYGAYVFEST